jgi:hypothetical protein
MMDQFTYKFKSRVGVVDPIQVLNEVSNTCLMRRSCFLPDLSEPIDVLQLQLSKQTLLQASFVVGY